MRVTDLITTAHNVSLGLKQNLHKSWIAQSFKLGAIAGVAHVPRIQANGRLDLLIRQLEEEWVPSEGGVDLSLDFRISLSECWVLRAYEVVCAADRQASKKDVANLRLQALHRKLALVRMPLAKAEVKREKGAEGPVILTHDGVDASEYVNDGTYIMPGAICSETGSVIWWPVDRKEKSSTPIRRIDLSNEMLTVFD